MTIKKVFTNSINTEIRFQGSLKKRALVSLVYNIEKCRGRIKRALMTYFEVNLISLWGHCDRDVSFLSSFIGVQFVFGKFCSVFGSFWYSFPLVLYSFFLFSVSF